MLPLSFLKVEGPPKKKQIGDVQDIEQSFDADAPKSTPVKTVAKSTKSRTSKPATKSVGKADEAKAVEAKMVDIEPPAIFADVSLTILGLDTGDDEVFDSPSVTSTRVITRAVNSTFTFDKTSTEPRRIASNPRPSAPATTIGSKPSDVEVPKAVPSHPKGRPPVTPTPKPVPNPVSPMPAVKPTPAPTRPVKEEPTTTTKVTPAKSATPKPAPSIELVIGDQSGGIVIEAPEAATPSNPAVQADSFISEEAVEPVRKGPSTKSVAKTPASNSKAPTIELLANGSQFETIVGKDNTQTKTTPISKSTARPSSRSRRSTSKSSKTDSGPKFVDLTVSVPKEGVVRRVEGMVAKTRSKGFPVAVIRSELPDSPWWVQKTTFFQPPYFKIHLRFGNEDTESQTRYRLVILMLETREEATRFMTADQITAIPEGMRRTRELNYVRK